MTLTCTAAVLRETGLPRPLDQSQPLKIETVTLLDPTPTDVVVKVIGAGLCHSDLSVMDGTRGRKTPIVLGHEGAGEVVEVGSGVSDVKVGDRVIFQFAPSCGRCRNCMAGRPQICDVAPKAAMANELISGGSRIRGEGGEVIGHFTGVSCFAQYAVVNRGSIVVIEDDIDLADAAVFGCAVMTGAGAAINTANVKPGESVAVFGLGGVGLSGVMGAKACGAGCIVALDPEPSKRAKALEMGATHAVDPTDPKAVEEVRDLTHGGVDAALELAGVTVAMETAYDVTARGGRIATAGLSPMGKHFKVHHADMVYHEKSILGSYMGSCVPVRDIPRFLSMRRSGAMPVDKMIDGYIGFDELNLGFEKLAQGGAVRQILKPHG
ncbi:zinc-binding dehydrogenase [Rhodovulum sp. DZ06]|uniref:zinc-binding dehydrogenase n=1 Tax=Rhodovulum sp. DZ06 TaxID=3425126 RepID=UPI003D3303FD